MEERCFYIDDESDESKSFWKLIPKERENIDYRIRWKIGKYPILIIAPHGGFIEPGTSIIAESIAKEDYWFYAFEGIKPSGNFSLHVPSNHFHEPRFLKIVSNIIWTLSIHGLGTSDETIFVGGRDLTGCVEISQILKEHGFDAITTCPKGIRGTNPKNVVNRANVGVQVEISRGLRNHVINMDEIGKRLIEAFRLGVAYTSKRFLKIEV